VWAFHTLPTGLRSAASLTDGAGARARMLPILVRGSRKMQLIPSASKKVSLERRGMPTISVWVMEYQTTHERLRRRVIADCKAEKRRLYPGRSLGTALHRTALSGSLGYFIAQ